MPNGSAVAATGGEIEGWRQELGMSVRDVWVGYFAVGGNGSMTEVERWLLGTAQLSGRDHDMLAQAVNDEFIARGLDHPVRYRDSL